MRMSRRLTSATPPSYFQYSYSVPGGATFSGDPKGDWTLTLTVSGNLTITSLPKGRMIDIFLVGGGGGGGKGHKIESGPLSGGCGGAGGKTTTAKSITPTLNTAYPIVIGGGGSASTSISADGGSGGTSSGFSKSATGGGGGKAVPATGYGTGGSGGSGGGVGCGGVPGGAGGSDGSNGLKAGSSNTLGTGGTGQGTTTRAFGEVSNTLYSGGLIYN